MAFIFSNLFCMSQEKSFNIDLYSGLGINISKPIHSSLDYDKSKNYYNYGISFNYYLKGNIDIGFGLNSLNTIDSYGHPYLYINNNSTINHLQYFLFFGYNLFNKSNYSLNLCLLGGSYFFFEEKYQHEYITISNPTKYILGIEVINSYNLKSFTILLKPTFNYFRIGRYDIYYFNVPTIYSRRINNFSFGVCIGLRYTI